MYFVRYIITKRFERVSQDPLAFLLMEKNKKNEKRIHAIERAERCEEKRSSLEIQFETEKSVFNDIASIKTKAEALRREAETAKKNSDFNKAA